MLSDLRTLVRDLERDASGLIDDDARDRAIALAVMQYDKDRPRVLVKDVATADGARLTLPAEWVAGLSEVTGIEHPLDQVPPAELAGDRWRLYAAPDGLTVMFTPRLAAGATVRLSITVPHQVDEAADTVPRHHREAVACWAAAHLMDALAGARAGDRDPNLAADTSQTGDISRTYAARAKTLRQRYADGIGQAPERHAGAAAMVSVQLESSMGGPRLFDRRRR